MYQFFRSAGGAGSVKTHSEIYAARWSNASHKFCLRLLAAATSHTAGPGSRTRSVTGKEAAAVELGIVFQDEAGSPDTLVSQEHSLQLVENLRKIYYEEECFLHDITLCSKDSGEVKAHKIILAAQSEYFKVGDIVAACW